MQFDIGTNQLGGAIHAVAGDNIDLRFQPFATGDQLVWNQPNGLLSLETSSGSVLAKLTLTGSYTQSSFTAMDDQHNGTMIKVQSSGLGGPQPVSAATIESDTLAITRTALPQDQATSIANSINAGTQTEAQYIADLLSQVVNTTIPAVAVEGSMYNHVGTSAEITELVTNFLPAQIDVATQLGLNPLVYASEGLGLAFAFADENGGTAFANNFGPSNPAMPATAAGDAAFAAAAATAIFGSAATTNTPMAIQGWVNNWEAFYSANGILGNTHPTADQVDLAARGAAWGDAIGSALALKLGPLYGQATNFLDDAAQGTAVYSASLASQPTSGKLGATNSTPLLSLAGGGIKAMTADAGLFAGLLDYFSSKGTTIHDLLSKVSAVSANSGSSWFTDLLAYQQSFDSSLQNYKSFFTSPTGYMQQLETAYNNYVNLPNNGVNAIIQDLLNSVGSLAGVKLGDLYALLTNSSADWNNFLSNVIFEPDNSAQLLQSVNFLQSVNSQDQPMRTGDLPTQSLIYQSAISSNDAAINKYSSFLGTATNETVSTITNAGTDASGNYVFIPVDITSVGPASNDKPAPSLPTISTGTLDVTYSTYSTLATKQSATTTLPNFDFDGLSAFLATSASSAAVSVVASGASTPLLTSPLLYDVQNVSPLVQVTNAKGASTASDPPPNILNGDTTPDSLTQGNSLLRLADGGYIDNTGVTSGLTYLQANNDMKNGFTVTALTYFDGVDPNLGKINPGYNKIGEQADVLFTGSNQNQTISILNASHPSAAVFDASKTTGLDNPIWEYVGSNGFKLDYFQLGVTTASNSMGITPGVGGTLNLWVVTTTAGALPGLTTVNWSQYSELYDQMMHALQQQYHGQYGAVLLANDLGYTVPDAQLMGVAPNLDHAMV